MLITAKRNTTRQTRAQVRLKRPRKVSEVKNILLAFCS